MANINVGDSKRKLFFDPDCPITRHYCLVDETKRVYNHFQFGLDGQLVFAHSENTRASYASRKRDRNMVKFAAEPEIYIDGALLAYAVDFDSDNTQHLSTRAEAYVLAEALQSNLRDQGVKPVHGETEAFKRITQNEREAEALEKIVQYARQHNLLR
jgi:hypothetical protein